jgi:hypothetical protein
VFAKLRSVGVEVRASDVVVREMAQLRALVASDRVRSRCNACAKPAKEGQKVAVRRPVTVENQADSSVDMP